MLDIMEVPIKSQNGLSINEEIYTQYNQLVYGSPLSITEGQRWKNVDDGKWTKGSGMWNGTGTRGEYWVLGFDVYGNEIHNHKFPVDIEPPTPPTEWRYVSLNDAEKSWTDTLKYTHEEQKVYMQTQKLMRNGITYDITALDIGLNKARAENYATWKTAGNIYTRRYDINNKEWAANFIVPPMAGDAVLNSILELPDGYEYTIKEDKDEIVIPINFGCEVSNLTSFAKPEHIKIIKSELLIEDSIKDCVEANKNIKTYKSSSMIINKKDYPNCSKLELEVSAKSLLLTEFTVDGALTDVESKVIIINIDGVKDEDNITIKNQNKVKNPEKPAPKIDLIKLGRVSKVDGDEEIVNLKIAKKTKTQFISAGQVLAIEVRTSKYVNYITMEFQGDSSIITFDELTQKFEYDEPKSRNQKTRYSTLNKYKNSYKTPIIISPKEKTEDGEASFMYEYVIPYKTKQTLHSWSTLRELSKDAFNIDDNKLFNRICDSYVIKIKAYSDNGVVTKSIKLDVFERWDTLYNRDINEYVR
jgi:hypothetical protein